MKVWSYLLLSLLILGVSGCSQPIASSSQSSDDRSLFPTLTLDVRVDDAARLNVTLTARLASYTLSAEDSVWTGRTVDFYLGAPLSTAYPSKYVGSAPLNKEGVATLRIHLGSGAYSAGALYNISPTGFTIRSNVVVFSVPAPISISLDVQTWPSFPPPDSFAPVKYNVAYFAAVKWNVPVITPHVKVDFYTAKADDPDYPSTYLGSAVTDLSGKAVLYVNQAPGRYQGGAIVASTPWGSVRAKAVFYKVEEIWTIQ